MLNLICIRLISTLTAILCSATLLHAQPFSPAAGEAGSEAISAGDESLRSWAVSCMLERGPGLIQFPDSIEVSNGIASFAIGRAGNEVVSLGDGGRATLTFDSPLMDGPGADLAVFENSFDGNFLELAFVEVSSDAEHFVRFPCSSLTPVDSQIGPFGILDPEKIHNLAGKYGSGWGTPFDLAELKDSSGLNINHIIAVRIIDVVGVLNDSLGSRDAEGRLINDPFPTPFETGGFDLDAVGVIHSSTTGIIPENGFGIKVFPNPCDQDICVEVNSPDGKWMLRDINGRMIREGIMNNPSLRIPIGDLYNGVYLLEFKSEDSRKVYRIIKNAK